MESELLKQIIIQAPTVGVLLYLLFRLDQRIAELITAIIDLSAVDED